VHQWRNIVTLGEHHEIVNLYKEAFASPQAWASAFFDSGTFTLIRGTTEEVHPPSASICEALAPSGTTYLSTSLSIIPLHSHAFGLCYISGRIGDETVLTGVYTDRLIRVGVWDHVWRFYSRRLTLV
jgi:hypothetical protein